MFGIKSFAVALKNAGAEEPNFGASFAQPVLVV
jgi:hypothetical protein